MKARFTITQKLIIGFGVLLLATLLNSIFIYSSLNQNQELNDKVTTVYNPSLAKLQELSSMVNNSQMLIKSWVFIEKQSNTPDKIKLEDIHSKDFLKLKNEIDNISQKWDPNSKRVIDSLLTVTETQLFKAHKTIMRSLNSFDNYDDMMVLMEVNPMIEDGGIVSTLTKNTLFEIDLIRAEIAKKLKTVNIEMNKSFSSFRTVVISLSIILALFILATGFFTMKSIVSPIQKLKQFLSLMTKGILPDDKMETNNDEIGDMAEALILYIDNMHKTSNFAVEIGQGNYDSKFEALSNKDILGNALINMRGNLKEADEKNKKRIEEDDIRNWNTKGLADFGDTLRQNSDNMDSLSKNIMRNLIDYLEVNQGAMYILNEVDNNNIFFEMKTAIAYSSEKFMKKNFELKEGLVGRCAYEKLPVYLKELPDEYIRITSGLGTAEPGFLLLVPLIIDDKVLGIIELASFNEILQFKIDFILSLGENIASTISNVRVNEQTKHLLKESKVHGDELSVQEEELRQNMEELQATQEEVERRELEMINTIDAINNTLGTVEIDMHGNIQSVNDNFLNKINLESNNLIGRSFQEFFAPNSPTQDEFVEIWSNLNMGINGSIIINYMTDNGEIWFSNTLTPFRDNAGNLNKVINLIVDITEQKQLEKELQKSES